MGVAQQLAYIGQEPFFGVFIDLKKAFDAMDRGHCLHILEGYGVEPNIIRLIKNFWDRAVLTCRANRYYGNPFKASRGVTHGGLLSPHLFNVMVDAVVREWLRQVLGNKAAKSGYGDKVQNFLALFYVDDGYIAYRNKKQLQEALDILIGLFERAGLVTNVTKRKQ